MRRLALLAALVASGALASPAHGQSEVFVGFGGEHLSSLLDAAVKGRGQVVIDFHGDAASGCEEAHLCDVSGTVTWSPGKQDSLLISGYRKDGKHFEGGSLGVGDELGYGGPPGTSARARRAGGPGDADDALCADVGSAFADSEAEPRPGSSVTFSLFGTSEVLRTRCAGPLTSDVSSLLPSRSIGEAAVRRGGAKLDFSADGQFAGHGLAGTLHSDVVLTVGKGRDLLDDATESPPEPGTRRQRDRYLTVTYRVESASGQVTTNVHGLTDPDLCGPLDSCGLLGTITTRPAATEGDGYLYVYARATHSRHELRQAAGLAPGRAPRGIRRVAVFEWQDGGSVTSDLSRGDAPACTDTAALAGGGLLDLRFSRAHATARLYGGGVAASTDLLRTRCPGPAGTDAGAGLASGRVALSQLGARHATLRLTRGAKFSSNGYRSTTTASLSVKIRRTHIDERVQNDPAGP